MITKTRYIIQHKDGHFITLKHDPVKEIDRAARFHTEEEATHFYRDSYYKVDRPDEYNPVAIKITYELGGEQNE